jgi:predicted kinase
MRKVIITKGIPASGKSTFARELMAKERGWKRINFDEIRATIDNGIYSPENEKIILKVRDLIIQESLKNQMDVIVDNTHIKDKGKHFNNICILVESLGIDCQVIEKHFYIDVEEALERDAKRANSVGEKVIRTFWKEAGGEGFKDYKPKSETFLAATKNNDKHIKHNPKALPAIVCDLDGSLALLNGRNPYDASECQNDTINLPVAETVKLYYNAGYKIIFCSGRIEKYREQTIEFIKKHLPGIEYDLFMRHNSDKRKDCIMKDEIFRREIEGKYNTLFCLDDRQQVVDHYRSIGLTVFQVAPGNF